jgi:hypothetical protein
MRVGRSPGLVDWPKWTGANQELAELLLGGMTGRQFGAFGRRVGHVMSRLREGLRTAREGSR